MLSGMLWLDTDKQRTLEEKVLRAAHYYEEKYGRLPQLCLVNEGMLPEETLMGDVHVRPVPNMVAHHFLLGVDASPAPNGAPVNGASAS